ncbi:MAG: glycosyltransferase family 2 protein [Bacteroidales bacterium]|nr:glycosyltransferase family 2 protein [Bacteroidales bacterium]
MQNSDAPTPLVSIGVPVYNGEKYLAECLQSVLDQTYQNWECYIINNRSTDNSLKIAESFQARDNRIKVITNPSFVGVNDNFNNTFKPVSKDARYYKILCADDWIFPEYLSRMVEAMEKHPEAGFCSSFRLENRTVKCDGLDYYKGSLFSGEEVLFDLLMYKYEVTGSVSTVLYRIEALKKIDSYPMIFNDNIYHNDTGLAYQLLTIADLAFVYHVLSYTRLHEEALTSTTANRYNTTLNFRENALYSYKSGNALLEEEYLKVRERYGWFLLRRKLSGDKKCIEWHRQHIPYERRYATLELFIIVLKTLAGKIKRVLAKLFHVTGKFRS